MIGSLGPWKQELQGSTGDVDLSRRNEFEDGGAAVAALEAGADLWSAELCGDGKDDNPELVVSFDDVFAHDFSAAIDDVVTALQHAAIPGAGRIYRSDRELIIVEPSAEDASADRATVTADCRPRVAFDVDDVRPGAQRITRTCAI